MVPAGRVICPRCDNVVDLSFLGETTRAGFDDDDDDNPFDTPTLTTKKPKLTVPEGRTPSGPAHTASEDTPVEPEPPTLRTIAMPIPPQKKPPVGTPKKAPPPPTVPTAPMRADAVEVELPPGPDLDLDFTDATHPAKKAAKSSLLHDEASDAARAVPPRQETTPSFLNEHTEADLSDLDSLLQSSTDALMLGDADDVVESLWVEESLTRPELEALPRRAGSTPDFLSAPTIDGTRDIIPVQVYVGADIARVIEKDAILEKVGDTTGLLLSSFEEYVLGQIDGVRPVARIQKRMGLTDGDLRIALALLVDKKLVQRKGRATAVGAEIAPLAFADPGDDATTVPRGAKTSTTTELPQVPRPPARHTASPMPPMPPMPPIAATLEPLSELSFRPTPPLPEPEPLSLELPVLAPPMVAAPMVAAPMTAVPRTSSSSSLPSASKPPPAKPLPSMPTDYASAPRTGLVVDDAGRSRAAALHGQCLRDLKNGAVARAYAVARMAHDAAPDVALYREIVEDWNNFVSHHKTADDARLHAQAVNAEAVGDAARAVTLLKQAAQANPNNAAVWNRLGLLLATRMKDIDGALDAMTKAIELAPSDPTFKNNFGKIAAMADRRGAPATSKGGLFHKLFGR